MKVLDVRKNIEFAKFKIVSEGQLYKICNRILIMCNFTLNNFYMVYNCFIRNQITLPNVLYY